MTNPLTFASGYSGDGYGFYTGVLKAINYKVTPSSQLQQEVQYAVGTLPTGLRPHTYTAVWGMCNDVFVYVMLETDGTLKVHPKSGNVSAGTNIWIRHTYM